MEQVCLTKYSHGGGCGCKIDPAALHEILAKVPRFADNANLLVGIESSDDAAVYKINDQQAIVITNDFFTPIVDDAYAFGRIAATNSISDVYAMGGTPIVAVSIVGFPVNKLPLHVMQDIMRGGVETCMDAGIPLAGGHSIDNEEPVFGLCVVGLVHPERIKPNSGARVGDVLITTKPLGVGILSTAVKVRVITPAGYEKVIRTMSTLNKPGAWLGGQEGVHALTDITGFGLAGHALEMARGAGVSIQIDVAKVPVMEEAWDLATEGIVPGGAYRNLSAYGPAIMFDCDLSTDHQLIFTDPQTSGGLLMAVAPEAADAVIAHLRQSNCLAAEIVGRVVAAEGAPSVTFHSSRPAG
jgi:selenide,water dikinase